MRNTRNRVILKSIGRSNNENIAVLTKNIGDNNLAKARELAELFAANPELLEVDGYLAGLSKKIGASCICVINPLSISSETRIPKNRM